MCFKRHYKIYHSKKRSLKRIMAREQVNLQNPIFLTINGCLFRDIIDLSQRYGTFIVTNATILPKGETALEVYSKDVAKELVNKGCRVIERR